VVANLTREIAPGALVVLAGSVPTGLPTSTWAALIADLNRLKVRVVLDTSGTPLAEALAAKPADLPYAIKPNRLELETYFGEPLKTEEAIVAAARELASRGIELVAVSLGEQGAIFLRGDHVLAAKLPLVQALSTVGAGDAMVAGIATSLADNLSLEALARRAVAFATAKLGFIGPRLPEPDDVRAMARQVQIRDLTPPSGS
jgi:1-phosphofructokinase